MIPSKPQQMAINTAQEFIGLLDQMIAAYDPESNRSMQWVLRDRELVIKFKRELQEIKSPEDVERFWAEAKDIPRILGCVLDDPLALRYAELQSKFYEDILSLVGEARTSQL